MTNDDDLSIPGFLRRPYRKPRKRPVEPDAPLAGPPYPPFNPADHAANMLRQKKARARMRRKLLAERFAKLPPEEQEKQRARLRALREMKEARP